MSVEGGKEQFPGDIDSKDQLIAMGTLIECQSCDKVLAGMELWQNQRSFSKPFSFALHC